ncbi:MAG TPA: YdeI/OmpD-associated family protein [Clostridiaceae bacterium]
MPDSWLTPLSADEWSRWLASHYSSESEVWLRIKKSGSKGAGVNLDDAVTEALRFGWIDSRMKNLDGEGFILRFSPRKPDSVWSAVNRKRVETLTEAGLMTEAGLATVRAAKKSGHWQTAYSTREKPEIPDDLRAELEASPPALENFSGWSNSGQLQAVFWIGQAKRPQTRISRIKNIAARAKACPKINSH